MTTWPADRSDKEKHTRGAHGKARTTSDDGKAEKPNPD